MNKIFYAIVFSLLFSLTTSPSFAQQGIPYYATIKASKANIRKGPSIKYPIEWVYQHRYWPVRVVATFENWRKVEDAYGEAGWIHENLLTSSRYVYISQKGIQNVYRLPVPTATVSLKVEQGVIAKLIQCKNRWCKIKADDNEGWISSASLWGVDANEDINSDSRDSKFERLLGIL